MGTIFFRPVFLVKFGSPEGERRKLAIVRNWASDFLLPKAAAAVVPAGFRGQRPPVPLE
ncbi:MAG TPA: hypothetical protein VK633_03265 [Verrucomicrobiae bacterium]|nr:hypothetical protein [Verrucomicrobiae bacterium]